MADSDRKTSETETILMALDQISQTIDVMTSVVARLRTYLEQESDNSSGQSQEKQAEVQPDKILH